jgi:RES domain-containing protein
MASLSESQVKTVWRIVTTRFAASAFSGEGARLFGGRWNRKGLPVVYTAESRSLALLEMMVQDDPLRAQYLLIPALVSPHVSLREVELSELGSSWRALSARDELQAIGNDWLQKRETCILSVPSAVVPGEKNFLINPLHPDFLKLTFGEAESLQTDVRLLRRLPDR